MCLQNINIAPCTRKTLPRVLVTKVAFWPLHPTRLCETMGAEIAVVSSLLVVNAPTAGSIHLFTSMIQFDFSWVVQPPPSTEEKNEISSPQLVSLRWLCILYLVTCPVCCFHMFSWCSLGPGILDPFFLVKSFDLILRHGPAWTHIIPND